jgi:hypothetical protein
MNLSFRQEFGKGSTGFGGFSPYVEGLPIEKYKELSPNLRIEYRNPRYLRCTDKGNDLEKIVEISEAWVKSIQKGVATGTFQYPSICPVVVGDYKGEDNIILDGNSRSAAAQLHTEIMPVIVVKTPEELAAVQKLTKTKNFYWIHGNERGFNDLMQEALDAQEKADSTPESFLEDVFERIDFSEATPRGTGLYFNTEIFGDSSLKYCVGRAAFKDKLGEPRTFNTYVLTPELHEQYFSEGENPILSLREQIEKHKLRERFSRIIDSSALDRDRKEKLIEEAIQFMSCGATDYEACMKRLQHSLEELNKTLKKE